MFLHHFLSDIHRHDDIHRDIVRRYSRYLLVFLVRAFRMIGDGHWLQELRNTHTAAALRVLSS